MYGIEQLKARHPGGDDGGKWGEADGGGRNGGGRGLVGVVGGGRLGSAGGSGWGGGGLEGGAFVVVRSRGSETIADVTADTFARRA